MVHVDLCSNQSAPSYATSFTQKRGILRAVIQDALRKVTGDPNARMRWTSQSYINHVWNKYWVALQGWNPHVPFKNPSNLPGGTRVFDNLIFRCERGIIRFVKIPEHERCNIDMTKVVPGGIVARKPWPGRPDIKHARHRPVSNPHNLPLRRQRPGPITPEYVWENADAEIRDDGTLEDDEIVETWDEECAQVNIDDEDPIEDWP